MWSTNSLRSEIRYQDQLGIVECKHYVEMSSLGGLWISLCRAYLKIHWLLQCDVSNEIVDFTKASSEITKRHLKNLGMMFANHEWIIAGEPVARNVGEIEEDVEVEA